MAFRMRTYFDDDMSQPPPESNAHTHTHTHTPEHDSSTFKPKDYSLSNMNGLIRPEIISTEAKLLTKEFEEKVREILKKFSDETIMTHNVIRSTSPVPLAYSDHILSFLPHKDQRIRRITFCTNNGDNFLVEISSINQSYTHRIEMTGKNGFFEQRIDLKLDPILNVVKIYPNGDWIDATIIYAEIELNRNL